MIATLFQYFSANCDMSIVNQSFIYFSPEKILRALCNNDSFVIGPVAPFILA
jgi:hypothetical protein